MQINKAGEVGPRKETLASRISGDLRESILRGELTPGSRINLDRLRETYAISVSSLREAVSRLVNDGLVVFEDQRGYRVAPVSAANLEEVVLLRTQFETLALSHAIDRAGLDWEVAVMGALHRLNATVRDSAHPATIEAWEQAHTAFHLSLIAGSGMPVLTRFCEVLHNLGDRYRRIFLATSDGDRKVGDEHTAIAEAAVSRQRDIACEFLANHITRTGRNLRRRLAEQLPATDTE